ncbi:hypothetical protein [Moorena producens]|nr:hypothetical protein [Moorena producens]
MDNKAEDLFTLLPFASCLLPFSPRIVFTTQIQTRFVTSKPAT